MGKAPPAFQFYPNDFVTGTRRMTTTEVGGYILLLCAQWDDGFVLGDDMQELANIMRCTKKVASSIWARVSEKFARNEVGEWRNARLEKVRREQQEFRARQADNGRLGGRPARKPNPNPSLSSGFQVGSEKGPNQKPNSNPEQSSPISDLQSSEPDNHRIGVSAGSQSLPPRAPAPLIPAGQSARWGVVHGDHVSEFCDWKCFPAELAQQFATQLAESRRVPHIEALRDVTLWARSVRESGIVPTGKMFDFWNGQWEAAHGSSRPVTDGAAGRAARTAQRLDRFVEHG